MDWGADGHTVVVVPVPELEPFVTARTRFYDPAWLSPDPTFTHAHVTVFAPWIAAPTPSDLAALADVAGRTPPFGFTLDRIEAFDDGTIHLPLTPAGAASALMRQVHAVSGGLLPYAGRFGSVDDLVPHVTLDRVSTTVSVASTRDLIGAAVPARCRADRLEVHLYREHDCRVLASFPLAG